MSKRSKFSVEWNDEDYEYTTKQKKKKRNSNKNVTEHHKEVREKKTTNEIEIDPVTITSFERLPIYIHNEISYIGEFDVKKLTNNDYVHDGLKKKRKEFNKVTLKKLQFLVKDIGYFKNHRLRNYTFNNIFYLFVYNDFLKFVKRNPEKKYGKWFKNIVDCQTSNHLLRIDLDKNQVFSKHTNKEKESDTTTVTEQNREASTNENSRKRIRRFVKRSTKSNNPILQTKNTDETEDENENEDSVEIVVSEEEDEESEENEKTLPNHNVSEFCQMRIVRKKKKKHKKI